MIHYLFFLALGLNSQSYAQSDSIIRWDADRKLTYADFLGQRPTLEISHDDMDTLAAVYCSIRYDIGLKSGKWVIHAYAFVEPGRSWMDAKNSYVLKHEQGHFDIAEIFSRKFEKIANDTTIADTRAYFTYVNGILQETFKMLNDENDKYDSYTMNTLGRDYYDKWIYEQLNGQPK